MALLRLVGVTCALVFVGLWWEWYADDPVRLVGPFAAVAWGAVFVAVCRHGRAPTWCVLGNVVLALAVAPSARLWLPPEVVGESSSWLYLTAVGASTIAAWCLRSAWWVIVPVACGIAFAAGAATLNPRVVAAEALLFVLTGAFRLAKRSLRRSAVKADAWLAAVQRRQTSESVEASRTRDRREQERVIHDTVLNTLTGIGWGGGSDLEAARSRCASGVAAVTNLLQGSPDRGGNLGQRISDVVGEAVRDGLVVDLKLPAPHQIHSPSAPPKGCGFDAGAALAGTDTVSHGEGGSGEGGAGPPPEVVDAIAAAVGEALRNTDRHAGTGSARVTLTREVSSVVVEITDGGVGFDPTRAYNGRFGLRESIEGRMADVGGTARIRSAPGQGTTVELRWSAGNTSGPDGGAVDRATGSPATTSTATTSTTSRLRQDFDAGLRRAVGAFAWVWLPFMFVIMAASWERYRVPELSAAAWIVTAAAVAPVGALVRRRALTRLEAAGLVALAVAGSVAVGLNTDGGDVVRVVNWFGVDAVPLLLALVAVSRPVREWLPAALCTNAVVLAVALPRAGTAPLDLTRLVAGNQATWGLLIMIASVALALRSTASTTALAAAAEVELDARRRSAVAVARDRRRRARRLADSVLPLLTSIADGTTDPRTVHARAACTAQATALRRILTTTGSSNRLAELEAAVESAHSRGVHVEVQVVGDLSHVPADVRGEVYRAVNQTLLGVRGGTALLTVLTSGAGCNVYLSFPASAALLGTRSMPGTGPAVLPAQLATDLDDLNDLNDLTDLTGPTDLAELAERSGLTEQLRGVADGRAYLEVSWDAPAGAEFTQREFQRHEREQAVVHTT